MRGYPARAACAAVLAVALLPACSTSNADTHPASSPTFTSAPASTPASPSPSPTTKQVVAARYAEFWRVFWIAAATNASRDPRLLDLTAGEERDKIRHIFGVRRADGRSGYGYSVPHVRSITVRGGVATILDCHDSSRAGIKDTRTGRKLNRGSATEDITVTMRLVAGRWRVSDDLVGKGGC
jgi:hypothetical protein